MQKCFMKGDSCRHFKPENAEAVRAVCLIPAEKTDSLWQLNIAWRDFGEVKKKGNWFQLWIFGWFHKDFISVSWTFLFSLHYSTQLQWHSFQFCSSSHFLCRGLILFHTNKGWQEMNGSVTIMTLAETGSSQVYSNC